MRCIDRAGLEFAAIHLHVLPKYWDLSAISSNTYIPVILILGRWKQEEEEFKATLS